MVQPDKPRESRQITDSVNVVIEEPIAISFIFSSYKLGIDIPNLVSARFHRTMSWILVHCSHCLVGRHSHALFSTLFLKQHNDSLSGVFTIFTGEDDPRKAHSIDLWNGKRQVLKNGSWEGGAGGSGRLVLIV